MKADALLSPWQVITGQFEYGWAPVFLRPERPKQGYAYLYPPEGHANPYAPREKEQAKRLKACLLYTSDAADE